MHCLHEALASGNFTRAPISIVLSLSSSSAFITFNLSARSMTNLQTFAVLGFLHISGTVPAERNNCTERIICRRMRCRSLSHSYTQPHIHVLLTVLYAMKPGLSKRQILCP
ncbi:hypothetical protein KP509_13G058100 [Ceratopteris richardii]|uniref:Uncharacterized protein n=1 Tax=Ceratopteris richardii TaxID=49495 RepID=A0A8T2TI66_CERRI|nr:hypothetical protein KP509_13G058100 [Ceratopteris richardii]